MGAAQREKEATEERRPPKRTQPRPGDGLWSKEDVAAFLGMGPDWVYRRASDGTLPHLKLGHIVRFRREDIEAWVKSQVEKSAPLPQDG